MKAWQISRWKHGCSIKSVVCREVSHTTIDQDTQTLWQVMGGRTCPTTEMTSQRLWVCRCCLRSSLIHVLRKLPIITFSILIHVSKQAKADIWLYLSVHVASSLFSVLSSYILVPRRKWQSTSQLRFKDEFHYFSYENKIEI